ncbi:hypothetical protein IW147_002768 [Coemansia sp. RSA 720]|nr:hypothetical protein IW147_002768 [Coemansia sp. RSA 720]
MALLSVAEIDALFKRVRISLHILDAPFRLATEPESSHSSWAARDIVGCPARRFLYHGERAQAFIVATLPNFDSVRWSLATSIKRTHAPELKHGELPLSLREAEQLFTLLRFAVTAFSAKTVPGSGNSSPAMQRTPASDSANIAHDASKLANSGPHKVSSMASAASFSAQVDPAVLNVGAIDKLDTGAWCCVYPFSMPVPAANDASGQITDTALMLEIRTTCLSPSSLTASPLGRLETASDIVGDRAAQLEDLAIRLSTEIRSHGENFGPQLFGPELDNLQQDPAQLESAVARRMVQILVATRPIVDISTRVVGLSTGSGAKVALVEVSVHCDSSTTCASGLALESVQLRSPDWHVESLSAHSPALPYDLVPGCSWSLVFKVSLLRDSARGDVLGSLKLLNAKCLLESGTRGVGPVGRYAGLSAQVCIGSRSAIESQTATAPKVGVLEINHFISISDQTLAPTVSALSDGATCIPSDVDGAYDMGSVPSTRSGRSLDVHVPNHRFTMEARRSLARDGATTHNFGHTKTVSLDIAGQTLVRKYSLANPSGRSQLADSTLMHTGERGRLGVADTGHALAQRSRAVTTAAHLHRPQSPVSTIQSISTGLNVPSERLSSDMDRESLRRRQSSVHTAIGHERQGEKCVLGAIDITFNVPPTAGLGDEIHVHMHLANNTSMYFARLCVVDDLPVVDDPPVADPEEPQMASAAVTRGLIPVEYATTVPPLPPGGSTVVVLKYTAAAPQFHAIGNLRLVDHDADDAKLLAIVEAPFVIYID